MDIDYLRKTTLRICLYTNTLLLIADLVLFLYLVLICYLGVPIESVTELLIDTSVDALVTYWLGGIISDFYYDNKTILFGMEVPIAASNSLTVIVDIIYSFICLIQVVNIIKVFTGG
jgi:hypothetical protein